MSWLKYYFDGKGAFAAPQNIFEALTFEQVTQRPSNAPHSIYELLWHLVFWQEFLLLTAQDRPRTWPKHAAEGWPTDNDDCNKGDWQRLLEKFF